MTSSHVSARRLVIVVSVLAAVTACGGAETTADLVQTTTSTEPAPTTSPTTSARSSVAETTTVPPETTTTMPATTTTTTTATGGEAISTELNLLSIVAISAGAGSGEYDITLAGRPDGLERYKVSTAGSDGACNARILGVRATADGAVVSVLTSPDPDEPCGGSTFGVAWVHADGRRSDITYRDCSAGITPTQPC